MKAFVTIYAALLLASCSPSPAYADGGKWKGAKHIPAPATGHLVMAVLAGLAVCARNKKK
jgi:hypothetical protein